jgi:catechol 2,3-dioxygenase-like lactoylglutathione lyase family enzyme
MEPRLSLVTLGVADLARAVTFYQQILGWKVAASPPGIAFFDLGGLVLALYPHADLAHDMLTAPPASRGAYEGFALAHNLRSRQEVDEQFASEAPRCDDRQAAAARRVGRLLGILCRPRRPPVGAGLQPVLDGAPGWAHRDVAALRRQRTAASMGGNIAALASSGRHNALVR